MKDFKQQQKERKKVINEKKQARPAAGQDSRKVHDTKGRNQHGRRLK